MVNLNSFNVNHLNLDFHYFKFKFYFITIKRPKEMKGKIENDEIINVECTNELVGNIVVSHRQS
jgi:hypothetical protein